MATINATGAATSVSPVKGWQDNHFITLKRTKIDFSETGAKQAFADGKADNSDVVQVLRIAAGWGVSWVATRVVTACTGASTITCDIGDGSGANSFDNDVDLTSEGYNISAVGTDAYTLGSPKVYSSADTLDLTLTVSGGDGGPIDTGVIIVMALVFDLSDTGVGTPAAA